jgi:hypothetical protein
MSDMVLLLDFFPLSSYLNSIDHKAFYFCADYRVAGPHPIEPSFEAKLARMQYAGSRHIHLSFMRYTGQWIQLYTDLTVDECIETIRDDPYFSF